MFKHRRVRVTCVLVVGWVFFAVVEQRSGQTTWPASLLHPLVWALAVSGTWWFAEMTQLGPRTARPVPSASATTNSSRQPGGSATGRRPLRKQPAHEARCVRPAGREAPVVHPAAHDTGPSGHPGKDGDPRGRGPAAGRVRKGGRHAA
ncbi:hypothetical protein [Streptomyces sp. NPDC088766]|uniref:hypothetical protein n=1 Tax=Streptomyces sp. NPDC088766 TaxID=3365893 RepID=UPI0037F72975